ncbi:MAG: glutamine-hydrolyzing carbamoyl-phosphate synthase small subunit [Candidatus Riflebacteria bacterium]|nr:glutamine-hydrolyzing carbamoyl-phosphate synthase small subunit [Candidatus Riflebacteria bacterium]
MQNNKIKLVLEDGTEFVGKSFGFNKSVAGEVVFNTAMTGYPENLSDPSYTGQILVANYPLIGNYGVPDDEKENGLSRYFESDKMRITALVISDYSFYYSHWNSNKSLATWLKENKVPGIYGIDTRALTKILREKGAMPGKVIFNEKDVEFWDPNKDDLVNSISTKEVQIYGKGKTKIILVDCGCKNNIIRCFIKRDCTVIKVPAEYNFLNDDFDGLFISNGPGDPKKSTKTIEHVKIALTIGKPIFGICLGCQILALASGADTFKLKYGHRSHNQPVLNVGTDRCYITSQNHGFAIDMKSMQRDWAPMFVNLNDNTCEGIKHISKPFFAVQFHPEASSGPTDTEYLFDEFLSLIKKQNESPCGG